MSKNSAVKGSKCVSFDYEVLMHAVTDFQAQCLARFYPGAL